MKLFVYLILVTLAAPAWCGRLKRASLDNRLVHSSEIHTREGGTRDCKGKCVTGIAQKAAAEAKAAQDAQNAAGAQAAHQVKTQLAEKALQAAKAAEAALAGKQAVVEQIQQEVKEAEAVVAENTASVHQQQATVNSAMQAAQQASAQHKLLCQVTQLAAATDKTTQCLLEKAKAGLALNTHNLEMSRSRLGCLQKKLSCECSEAAIIKQAWQCACESAKCACENAKCKRSEEFRNSNESNALATTT